MKKLGLEVPIKKNIKTNSFSGREMLVAHLGSRQCPPQHVLVLWLKAIKFNFNNAKR